MAKDSVQILRSGLEAYSRGGVEAMLEFVDPAFEMTTPANLTVEPGTYRGHEGIRRYFDSFYEAMDRVRLDALEYIDAGDRVVTPMRMVARGRGTGIELDQQVVAVWTVRGGKVIRCEPYANRAEALAAAGLPAETPLP